MKWNKENNEVLYSDNKTNLFSLSAKEIKYIKKLAQTNHRKRIRVCAHKSIKEHIHEMIIYHPKGTYVRPHKHLNKDESFHIISGKINLVIFDNIGNVTKNLSMGEYKSGNPFYYRIRPGTFHTQIFIKDTIFHEVTRGPFKKKDTVFADWAPKEK